MEERIFYPSFEIRDKPYSESEWRQIGENIDRLAKESLERCNERENAKFVKLIAAARLLSIDGDARDS